MVLYAGVNELKELFVQNGWTSRGLMDDEEGITYYKKGHETVYFQMSYNDETTSEDGKPIFVSVPMRHSEYQYVLYFKYFKDATNYITKMFSEYTNSTTENSVTGPLCESQGEQERENGLISLL